MAAKMGRYFDNLQRKEVVAGHWALVEAADETNEALRQWFKEQVAGNKSSL